MREIKFRAWDKDEKYMRDWNNLLSSVRYGPNRLVDSDVEDSIFNDPDFIIMQYTEFADKDGVKLYDGDIITQYYNEVFGEVTSEIRWLEFRGMWGVRTSFVGGGSTTTHGLSDSDTKYKVIGDIYQTPELFINAEKRK